MSTPLPWELVSSAYAEEVVPMFEPYARDALQLAAPPAGSRVVDVACGPGTLSMLAARAGHVVDALDFSPAMIERCEARKRALGVDGVTARLGDGQQLPFADGAYAAGFSMFGLMFFPDRARGFRELRRVLAPGARAVVGSWARLEDNPVLAALFGALRATTATLLGPAAPKPGGADMPLSTPDACRAEMSEAFADVEVHRVTHGEPYQSAADLWAGIQRTNAMMLLMRRNLGEDKWAVISDAALAALRAQIGDEPGRLMLPAWLSVGVAR